MVDRIEIMPKTLKEQNYEACEIQGDSLNHDMCCALLASSSLTGEKKQLVMCISVDRRLSKNIICPAVSRDIVLNPILVVSAIFLKFTFN